MHRVCVCVCVCVVFYLRELVFCYIRLRVWAST